MTEFIEPELIKIPSGKVLLGSPPYSKDMKLPHPWRSEVEIELKDFYIGKYAVTRKEFSLYLKAGKDLPADWDRENLGNPALPATGLSWNNANSYAEWLSKKTGKDYRLPKAFEWEKAARGGLTGKKFPWGDDSPKGKCCYGLIEADTPLPVGSFNPNGYGLYDMAGNVWEWCADLYLDCANDLPKNSPTGKDPKINRVLRGGSYMTPTEKFLYCAYIHEDPPDLAHICLGMRLVLDL